MSLDGKPDMIEELKIKIKEKCNLWEDFNNALCNLDDIRDLPATRAPVKVIPLLTLTLVPASAPSMSDASNVSDDTEILSTHSSSSSTRQERWPEFSDIPNFLVDVEFRLRQANLAFLSDQTYLNVPRDLKHCILEKLAEEIYKFDAYPSEE